jgi:hypothetical protein
MRKNVASKAKAPIFLPCYSLLEAPVPAECFHQRRASTRRLSYQDGIDAQEGSTLKHTTSFQQGNFLSTAAGYFLRTRQVESLLYKLKPTQIFDKSSDNLEEFSGKIM